jgi:hypothetical protein
MFDDVKYSVDYSDQKGKVRTKKVRKINNNNKKVSSQLKLFMSSPVKP